MPPNITEAEATDKHLSINMVVSVFRELDMASSTVEEMVLSLLLSIFDKSNVIVKKFSNAATRAGCFPSNVSFSMSNHQQQAKRFLLNILTMAHEKQTRQQKAM